MWSCFYLSQRYYCVPRLSGGISSWKRVRYVYTFSYSLCQYVFPYFALNWHYSRLLKFIATGVIFNEILLGYLSKKYMWNWCLTLIILVLFYSRTTKSLTSFNYMCKFKLYVIYRMSIVIQEIYLSNMRKTVKTFQHTPCNEMFSKYYN